jgi:hypothetical protein
MVGLTLEEKITLLEEQLKLLSELNELKDRLAMQPSHPDYISYQVPVFPPYSSDPWYPWVTYITEASRNYRQNMFSI